MIFKYIYSYKGNRRFTKNSVGSRLLFCALLAILIVTGRISNGFALFIAQDGLTALLTHYLVKNNPFLIENVYG